MSYAQYGLNIINCKNYGKIDGTAYVGGILGLTSSGSVNFKNCINFGEVTGTTVGGIIGQGYGTNFYSCCSAIGSVVKTLPEGKDAGGIVGYNTGAPGIYNCLNLGTVISGVNARTDLWEETKEIMILY